MTTTIKMRVGMHEKGTKAYVLIRNPNGAIHPYGFAIWGGLKKKPTITNYGRDKFLDQEGAKTKGGYRFHDLTINVPEGDNIEKFLCTELGFGYPMTQFHPDAMKMFLDMYKSLSGREITDATHDEASDMPPVPPAIAEAIEMRKAALADKVKSNSNWGAF